MGLPITKGLWITPRVQKLDTLHKSECRHTILLLYTILAASQILYLLSNFNVWFVLHLVQFYYIYYSFYNHTLWICRLILVCNHPIIIFISLHLLKIWLFLFSFQNCDYLFALFCCYTVTTQLCFPFVLVMNSLPFRMKFNFVVIAAVKPVVTTVLHRQEYTWRPFFLHASLCVPGEYLRRNLLHEL